MNHERVKHLTRELLMALGENPDRPGLKETPRRFADWWSEFLDYQPGKVDTCFESVSVDQLVIVSDIRVWSLCEHHLLPFWCDLTIGYLCQNHVIGLSKIGRIAHYHAHKLQLQEQLVQDIAKDVAAMAKTESVAVLAKGEHLCMTVRGIKTPHRMISSAMLGQFRDEAGLRQEFLSLAK